MTAIRCMAVRQFSQQLPSRFWAASGLSGSRKCPSVSRPSQPRPAGKATRPYAIPLGHSPDALILYDGVYKS